MSGKISGLVWDADLPQSEKLVLLAYADHADHWGNSIYPSVGRIAWKTGYSERSVQRITKSLIEKNILVHEGKSKLMTNEYRIDLDALPERPPYKGGDNLTPPTNGGVTSATKGGDKMTEGGDIAMSPKPSFKPSVKTTSEVAKLYQSEVGNLNSNSADVIAEWVDNYPISWIKDAIGEAKKNKAKHPNYVTSILSRWERDGKDNGKDRTKEIQYAEEY